MDEVTQSDLDFWFREFNSSYFDSSLSNWRVQHGYPPDIYNVGLPNGYCDRKEKTIYIGFCGEGKAKKILIHEMVHASGIDWHGKRFRNELNRVKSMGAPVRPSDLKPRPVPNGDQVREMIIECIRDGLNLKQAEEETAFIYKFRSRETLMKRFPKATQIEPDIIEMARWEEPTMEILSPEEIDRIDEEKP
ncbi:MAG: hypothetical protein KAU50_09290 [Candidatus Marinimicrobia bacterium]|nr:hypothetical protein [Candidatus Neomarinimicrobiota bacterium]